MSEQNRKRQNAAQRAARTRSTLHGTAQRPRFSVNISNKNIVAQLIDDDKAVTIISASSLKSTKGTLTDKAAAVGAEIAKQAKSKKVKFVTFDRGGKQYHGRVKALADADRENGLEF